MQVTKSAVKSAPPVQPNLFVPLDHIVNSKDLHYRGQDQAHVDALVADIGANGLDSPLFTFAETSTHQVKIKGAPTAIPATYLVAGLHRRAALLKLRREQAEVFKKRFPNGIPVLHRVCNVAEALLLQVRENCSRKEMSAEEIFPILEKLAADPFKMTGKQIASKVGKSTAWVSQMMAVNAELDPETQVEVRTSKIAVGDARKLAGEVRAGKKAGAPLTKETIRAKAEALKHKQAQKSAGGGQRASGDERKVSLAKVWGRYRASCTSISTGRKVTILEDTIRYVLGELKTLSPELRIEKKPSKVTA